MPTTLPPLNPGRAQLVERRLQRVAAISSRSRQGRDHEQELPENDVPPEVIRRKRGNWLAGFAGAVLLAAVAVPAARWWNEPSAKDIQAGKELFKHEWKPNDPLSRAGDGLGPVFNEVSCVACHFQGGVGGGGALKQNVAAFEVLPTEGHPQPGGGVVHTFAVRSEWQESKQTVRAVYPVIPKGATITAICVTPIQTDYDPVIHNSINTPTLFGAGAIDRIPGLAIRAQHTQQMLRDIPREFQLEFDKSIGGRPRVLPDGRIGKFGWKAQFATLEEFVANACAVEVGLSTPTRKQHLPKLHAEDPGAKPDLDSRQFRQLVSFVSKLPAPISVPSADSAEQAKIDQGRQLFATIGCAACHVPDWGEVRGVYSDFCLHDLTDRKNNANGYRVVPIVPVPDDHPLASEWKTPPLWGVAQTAPYFHDGSAETLAQAIARHGGQAHHTREAYQNLQDAEQKAVLAFLHSLRVPESPSEGTDTRTAAR